MERELKAEGGVADKQSSRELLEREKSERNARGEGIRGDCNRRAARRADPRESYLECQVG